MTRSFTFDGTKVVGCLIRAPILDWNILVVSPVELAYRSALTTTGIFATALCMALLLASGLSLLMSHSLVKRFEKLVSHARRIESGEKAGEWPKAPIREFNLLGEALQSMANTLRERETSLNDQLHFLQQLLDSIPIPVYYKDTEDCTWDATRRSKHSSACREATLWGKPCTTWLRRSVPTNTTRQIRPCFATPVYRHMKQVAYTMTANLTM